MKYRKIRLLVFCVVILSGMILHIVSTESELFRSIGIELSAAGFVAILLEMILRDEFIEVIKKELRSPLKMVGIGHTIAPIYVNHFQSAKERIDIIALTFASFLSGIPVIISSRLSGEIL